MRAVPLRQWSLETIARYCWPLDGARLSHLTREPGRLAKQRLDAAARRGLIRRIAPGQTMKTV